VSGFLPNNHRPLSEARDEIGSEALGVMLATGSRRAVYVDPWGTHHPLSPAFWRGPKGRAAMESGAVVDRRARPPEYGGGIREERQPILLEATGDEMTPEPPPSPASDTRPDWWPHEGQTLTDWTKSAGPGQEAERRLREQGHGISERALCATLEVMWTSAGGTHAEGTIARVRRRLRR
jgi:hypothetical protein